MNKSFHDRFDFNNAIVAFGVWLLVISVYSLTRAATLSFWDCGEFITASYVLGIPHPPGTPLYVMIGRIFTLLPLSSDIAVRTNLMSGFCSSIAALFAYLTSVRILRLWFGVDRSRYSRLLVYSGSAAGALFFAFGLTNWTNSVETEVYGIAMMFMTVSLWLTMIYYENKDTILAERIMLLIVFVAFLGIGVHMTTFLILPVAALFFIIKKESNNTTWYMMTIFFVVELYLVFILSSRPGEIPWYLPSVVVFV
ncbi:MAG: DUF2723 domain-containing protein, partial [candidate division Zixibacteria bacterium]|nr:DUF2723 domain-containing protein [candidate division Zixibacteria bacterium]